MADKRKVAGDHKRHRASRRKFIKAIAGAAALPFTLLIPSKAAAVLTTEEQLLPFRARQAEFRNALDQKLAQAGGLPGTAPRVPPPPPKTPPPQRVEYTTSFDTSVETRGTEDTFSGTPPKSDDTNYVTHHDGNKTDYKTDYS